MYVTTENPRMFIRKNMKRRETQIKIDGGTDSMATHKRTAKDKGDRDVWGNLFLGKLKPK